DNISGEWYISETKYGPFVHAKLGIAEENSGKLVTEVRKNARSIAEKNDLNLIIIDGPPGIGCPVIASLSGVDLALVITEPTLSGIHDMERVINVARHFKIKVVCCINKYDLNVDNTRKIENWCNSENIPVIGKIPYSEEIIKSMVQGIPIVEYTTNNITKIIQLIWKNMLELLV
ncbi:P-loop NTPase, partial [Candidatus Aminicenantes bacterium AC-708-I09]|nr:P-loop NTPase [Candidatus Aminicenantes bacterium AC-708-I09]